LLGEILVGLVVTMMRVLDDAPLIENVVSDYGDDDDLFESSDDEEDHLPEYYTTPEYLLRVWQDEGQHLIESSDRRQGTNMLRRPGEVH
jgi:hypothetical protein